MKLEKQVCSLELAKRLKELGVKQESAFAWVDGALAITEDIDRLFIDRYGHAQLWGNPEDIFVIGKVPVFAAFTVAELGEMYPKRGYAPSYPNGDGRWAVSWFDDVRIEADTEADARAKMLIYLIEQKLL